MKKYTKYLVSYALVVFSAYRVYAGTITHTDYSAGNVITAAGQNTNENAIVNEFNGNIDDSNIKASANITTTKLASFSNAINFTIPGTYGIQGSTAANNASAGYYGEYTSSTVAAANAVSMVANQFVNIAQLSLTAGDWDVTGMGTFNINSASGLTTYEVALSSFSANTTTDHITGDNVVFSGVPSSAIPSSLSVPYWRVSLNSTVIIYLKGAVNNGVTGNPTAEGRISARRMR